MISVFYAETKDGQAPEVRLCEAAADGKLKVIAICRYAGPKPLAPENEHLLTLKTGDWIIISPKADKPQIEQTFEIFAQRKFANRISMDQFQNFATVLAEEFSVDPNKRAKKTKTDKKHPLLYFYNDAMPDPAHSDIDESFPSYPCPKAAFMIYSAQNTTLTQIDTHTSQKELIERSIQRTILRLSKYDAGFDPSAVNPQDFGPGGTDLG